MDGLNDSSPASRDEFCDLILDGLILWRLTSAGQCDLWCMVFKFPDGLCFVIDDDPLATKPHRVREQHGDIVSLVNSAEAMKRCFVMSGWAEGGIE